MMHCCFGHPHQLCQLSLGTPLPQWYTLDTLLNELQQILRHSPGMFFFWDNSSGELIMPMVHMCSTCFHSVCIHVEPFGNGNDGTSFEMVFCCHQQQHGDCLQALIICQICFEWVTMGCLLVRGILRFHCPLKLVLQTLTLFSLLLFAYNFQTNDNQTFNVYAKSTLSMYRKGLCGFSPVLAFTLEEKLHGAKCCKFYRPEGVPNMSSKW